MVLSNKVALVTGAARGIGAAIAEAYLAAGARVMLADVDPAVVATSERLDPSSIKARAVVADVGMAAGVASMIQATVAELGRLDILVNNAGINIAKPFLEVTEEDFDRVLGVNLKGAFLATQAAARVMIRQGDGGAIVNLSSVNAVMAIPSIAPYNVSKGGLAQLTRVAALALVNHRIRVNAIGPGSIATEMLNSVMTDAAARRAILSRTPMGRAGRVEEVASVAVFLASEASSYVTGQTIYVDGGRMPLNYTVPVPE
jgi:NAD(P)-dependent dehydrogenase (short-subunit alcohol dehydrogenase family)